VPQQSVIGLVGGMSWESSAEYYRIINQTVRDRLGACCEIAGVQVIGGWEECGMRHEAALCGSLHPFRGLFCGLIRAADRVPV